jgi:Luciferase-like monooxygenase
MLLDAAEQFIFGAHRRLPRHETFQRLRDVGGEYVSTVLAGGEDIDTGRFLYLERFENRLILDFTELIPVHPAFAAKIGKRPVPTYISAEGPKTLRVAGRVCDGVILGTGFDLDVLEWAEARIAEGAKEGGRDLAEIDIMPAGMIYVDDDGAPARKRVRSRMANRAHHNFRFTMETRAGKRSSGRKEIQGRF